MPTKRKIIIDPVCGFISLPMGLLYDLVRHPVMQRLTRIRQLGMSPMVYPGAQHTRFQHSLGAYHLATQALQHLMMKGNVVLESEEEAVEAAVLLHDVGHGPLSHVLEGVLVDGVSHEDIGVMLMERLNEELNGRLSLAIRIFKDEYPRHFLHQLISGQLDVDRLDYLRRDSFYTGVREGNIGSERIIEMLDVNDDRIVLEAKGLYTIENFLVARRLMYGQVYLHKTSVACERMLVNAIRRARDLMSRGVEVPASPALKFFLCRYVDRARFLADAACLDHFVALDDSDVWTALKAWCTHDDRVLSLLSRGVVCRQLFKVEVTNEPPTGEHVDEIMDMIARQTGLNIEDAAYFVSLVDVENKMYDPRSENIEVIHKDGRTTDVAMASDLLSSSLSPHRMKKYYLCRLRAEGE